jgi:hypothetical protein
MIVDFTRSRNQRKWFCNICTPPSNGHVEYMSIQAAQHHERHSAEHTKHVRDTAEMEMWWNPPAQDAAAWTAPIVEDPPLTIEEMKMRESRMRVDQVQDMVPFWIKGVEAAAKGEVLRLEQFLETLQEASDTWLNSTSDIPWMHADPEQGWGEEWGKLDGWNVDSLDKWAARSPPSMNGSSVGSDSRVRRRPVKSGRQRREMGSQRNRSISRKRDSFATTFDFVEHVARQQSADEERKQRMHTFFDVRQSYQSTDSCLTNVFQMPTDEKLEKIDEVIRYLHASHER